MTFYEFLYHTRMHHTNNKRYPNRKNQYPLPPQWRTERIGIQEELACYARNSNMSRDMKRKFNFVNITGIAFTNIPDGTLHIIERDN